MGDPVPATQVVRPDVCGEPVAGVVGESDRVVLVVERRDADDRPEDLFLEDAHVGPDVGEHRRGEVVAGVQVCGALAAGHQAGAFGDSALDVGNDSVVVLGGDERTQLGCGIARVTDANCRGPLAEHGDELVVQRSFHEERGSRRCSVRR